MSNFEIEKLISLLEKGQISKEELLAAMNNIQFQQAPHTPPKEETKTDQKPIEEPQKEVSASAPNPSEPTRKDLEENIQNLEKAFEPILNDDPSLLNSCIKTTSPGESPLKLQDIEGPEVKKDGEVLQAVPIVPSLDLKKLSEDVKVQFATSPPLLSQADASNLEASSTFLIRNDHYVSQKELRRRERENQLLELQQKECSFHPKINKTANSSPKTGEEIGDRLHRSNRKEECLEQIRYELEKREAEDILQNCTFQPCVYSKYAKSKYMVSSKDADALKGLSVSCKSMSLDEYKYTFRPEINKLPEKGMEQAKKYLSGDPYTRLSQSANKAQKMLDMYESVQDEICAAGSKDNGNAKERLKQFYERQNEFEVRKQENKQKLLNEIHIEPTPKIDAKSEAIAKNLIGFEERNEALLNRAEDHATKHNKDYQREYTFQPDILPVSKGLKPKNYDELSYSSTVQKEVKLEQLKKTIADLEAQVCTFKPELDNKKYASVQSKLKLKDGIDTYVDRVQMQREKQEALSKIYHQSKEQEEIAHCTHAPKITELPYYMRIKKEIEARSSNASISKRDIKGTYAEMKK